MFHIVGLYGWSEQNDRFAWKAFEWVCSVSRWFLDHLNFQTCSTTVLMISCIPYSPLTLISSRSENEKYMIYCKIHKMIFILILFLMLWHQNFAFRSKSYYFNSIYILYHFGKKSQLHENLHNPHQICLVELWLHITL